jgi:inosine/xanthosine triphosphatase
LNQTLRIVVGSTRRPKVEAVKAAADSFALFFGEAIVFEVEGFEAESGVSHTPISRKELMRGARQRAEMLQQSIRESGARADFFVGVEGGLDVVVDNRVSKAFLESWAFVSDGSRGHFGCSGSIELPEALIEEVLEQGIELSVAIDRFAGQVGIRDGQGAWGVLSRNLISRQESFQLAVIAAFAPFYNAKMYHASSAATG